MSISRNPVHDLPLYLTPDEAATLLRTSRKAIYVMIERQQIPGVTRIGKRILIRTKDLLDWLDQQCVSSLQEIQR
jgi:excisionase family DNA binding protein